MSSRRVEWIFHRNWLTIGLLLLLSGAACGGEDRGPVEPEHDTPTPTAPVTGPVVSEPALADAAVLLSVQPRMKGRVAAEEVSYVSLRPGSVPEADSIHIRNETRDLAVGDRVLDGGFDPIAIPATVGDVLEVTMFREAVPIESEERVVPDRRPPIVVRSSPAPGRTRVPLNSVIVIVFSEPVDPASAASGEIRLELGGSEVPSAVDLSTDGLRAEIIPDAPLEPASAHTVIATMGVLDLAGDALDEPFAAEFTTIATVLVDGIAFESNRTRANEIWLMNADGSDEFQLTAEIDGGVASAPSVSPDGRQIAFSVFRNEDPGFSDLYVMNVDGTGVTNLTGTTDVFEGWRPTWSPDGSRIAYLSNAGGDEDIWVMNADGSGQLNLTNSPGSDANPAWSPDGATIAFVSARDGDEEIYVMDADGSNQTRVTFEPGTDDWPAWSPDGQTIAFNSTRGGDLEIWLMDADGSSPRQLTDATGYSANAAFSADGQVIAFESSRAGTVDIWTMNLDGSELTNLTVGSCCAFFPSWGQ